MAPRLTLRKTERHVWKRHRVVEADFDLRLLVLISVLKDLNNVIIIQKNLRRKIFFDSEFSLKIFFSQFENHNRGRDRGVTSLSKRRQKYYS